MTLPRLRLLAVNVGRARTHEVDGRKFRSAILKAPVEGGVAIGPDGVDGDRQADTRVHGGPNKAVYLYSAEHYAAWQRALKSVVLPPGTFGENLTLDGAADLERELHVGDVLRVGAGESAALLKLTTPRQPCWKLEARMGLKGFARAFLESRRMGSYARVVAPGRAAAGDPVEVVERSARAATLRDLIDALYFGDANARERVLADEALDESLRRKIERAARAAAREAIDAGEEAPG